MTVHTLHPRCMVSMPRETAGWFDDDGHPRCGTPATHDAPVGAICGRHHAAAERLRNPQPALDLDIDDTDIHGCNQPPPF